MKTTVAMDDLAPPLQADDSRSSAMVPWFISTKKIKQGCS
jgi:hypothetical protein